MAKRLISSAVGIFILIVVLFSNNMYLLEGCVTIVAMFSMYELFRAVGLWKYKGLAISGCVFGVVIMFFQFSGIPSFYGLILLFIVTLFMFLIIGYGKIKFSHICMSFLISVVVPVFLLQIVNIRFMTHGKYLIYLIFIASFVTDAVAFFVGRAIGRRKFAPAISPNKTLEGAIGGAVGGILGFMVFGIIMEHVFALEPNYLMLLLVGAAACIIAEIGDLAASAIKREFDIKDFGDVMPGHGGVMDRFDSVLFVAPLLSLLLYNFTVLV
jgi:phosphatidate cytidylyltransferase